MYEDKTIASGAAPMEHMAKETYFRDVHLFLEHARDEANIKGVALIGTNLWTCFKRPALGTWLCELSENDKRLAKLGDKLDEWERMLIDKFKAPANVAMDTLLKEKYTLRDASQRREPGEYAQNILRASKDAGFTSTKNQLDVIYNGIDPELRRGVRRPKEKTTISDFLDDLEDFKHDWWILASRHGSRMQGPANAGTSSTRRFGDNNGRGKNYGQFQSRLREQQSSGTGQQPYYGSRSFQPNYAQQQPFPRQNQMANAYPNQQQNSSYQNRTAPPDQRSSVQQPQRQILPGKPNRSGFQPQRP